MVSGFSDYRSPVGMADENCRSVLRCKSSLGNCYVVLQRYRRILDDADAVAVSLQDLVDALPASAVNKATVDENDVLHGSKPPSFNDAVYIGGTGSRAVTQWSGQNPPYVVTYKPDIGVAPGLICCTLSFIFLTSLISKSS